MSTIVVDKECNMLDISNRANLFHININKGAKPIISQRVSDVELFFS